MENKIENQCNICGETIWKMIDFPLLDGTGKFEQKLVRCSCRCDREKKEATENRFRFEEAQRRISNLRRISLMDEKLKGITFSTYKVTQENSKAFNFAKRYVENFDDMYKQKQGLMFWGDVGTGKSYTAAVIANELLNREVSVVMTSFIKLLGIIGSFESGDNNYIDRINQAKLLVIDDLGAERGTDFALENVYNIIDSRDRSGKPLILTTNLSFAYMQDCEDIRYKRIYDRIFEMCYPVQMTGLSWRKKEAVTRFDKMKKLLEG